MSYGSSILNLTKFLICVGLLTLKIKLREISCKGLGDWFRLIQTRGSMMIPCRKNLVSSNQKEKEIVDFLDRVRRIGLRAVCEIGTAEGGTFYLLARVAEPDATLMTVDPVNDWRKALILRLLARPMQKVHVVGGDSRNVSTINRLAKIVGRDGIDLLFIDGDHTYEGVKNDFEHYSGFVRKGGWVAFHDIVPDHRTRHGINTYSYTGQVPLFWKTIKDRFPHFEIVDNYEQDGYGIGVIVV